MNSTAALSRQEILFQELKGRSIGLTVIEVISYLFLMLATIFGNCSVLWIVYKKRNENRMTYYLIGSLALSDLCLALFPGWEFIAVLSVSHWPFSHALCQFDGYIIITLVFASLWTMASTAFNRYLKVVRPTSYQKFFSKTRTKVIILESWLLSVMQQIPYIASGKTYKFHPGKAICFQDNVLSFTLWMEVCCFVPVTIIIVCYYLTFNKIRRHQAKIKKMKSDNTRAASGPSIEEIRATRTLFLTVVGFVLCWMPIIVIDIVDLVRGFPSASRQVYVMYSFMGATSSAINPFIYGALDRSFNKVRRHQAKIKNMKSDNTRASSGSSIEEIRATRTLFLTVVGFVLCWMPITVIDIVDLVRGFPSASRQVYVMYTFIGGTSSAINPFIYGALDRSCCLP